MHRSPKILRAIAWIASLMLMIGCDDRAAHITREAADRQAQQNTVMAELNQEVASGTHRLVEADAEARKEIVGVHRDLQSERVRLDSSWNDLELQRRQMAGQRRTESLLAPAVQAAGLLAVVALVLGFSWYALMKARHSGELECTVTDLLLNEVLANEPRQLSGERPPLLDHSHTENSLRT